MGQNLSKPEPDLSPDLAEDNVNTTVVIEKSKSSLLSDCAEGTYILPNTTNCVKISDLIFSLVKAPIVLYMGGQDVTHNYTQISMFSSLKEDSMLYLVYSERPEKLEESVYIEDYIKEQEISYSGPVRIILKPMVPKSCKELKLKVWEGCTIKQLQLLLKKILQCSKSVTLYKSHKLISVPTIFDLKPLIDIDGALHLRYSLS